MRLFVAFGLNKSAARNLLYLARKHYAATTHQWYPPDKLHLTLQFLGEVDSQHLSMIKSIIAPLLESVEAFELEITKFTLLHEERLVALTNNPHELQHLQQKIHQGLASFIEFKDLYQFRPHITLAKNCAVSNPANNASVTSFPITCERVVLYQSLVQNNQSIYHKHHAYTLPFQS